MPLPVDLSIVIVCFGGDVVPVLDALQAQRRPGDEVLCVDNLASAGGTTGVAGHPAVDELIEPDGNLHYAAGADLGAARARGDVVLLLNPDAVPEAGFLDAIRQAPSGWSAWSGVLTLPGGGRVNNGGGVVHLTGLAWSGRFDEPVASLPAAPYEAGFLTGGCLAVRRPVWDELGGYADGYGAYHEDTELSLRLRLAGHRFGFVPDARAEHDYLFDKGDAKWRFLEANRWRTIVRTYPAPVLAAAAPVLVAAELGVLAGALAGGWLRPKLAAYGDLRRWAPRARAERRAVQATRVISARAFADALVAELDSPFLGAAGRAAPIRLMLRAYWSLARALLPRGAAATRH